MKKTAVISRTSFEMAILFKYVVALILGMVTVALSRGIANHPFDIFLAAGFAVWALFSVTAAEVRASEQSVECRRFLSWKAVRYGQIVECKKSWHPWYGLLKLNRPVLPWGKIYFLRVRPAFRGRSDELVALINSRREQAPPMVAVKGVQGPKGVSARSYIVMGLLGLAFSLVAEYLDLGLSRQASWEGLPRWYAISMTVWDRAFSWPWGLITLAVLIMVALGCRYKRYYAQLSIWLAGILLGSLLLRAIR